MTMNSLLLLIVIGVIGFVLSQDASGTYLELAQAPLCAFLVSMLCIVAMNRRVRSAMLETFNIFMVVFFVLRVPFVFSEDVISDVYLRNVELSRIPFGMWLLTYQTILLALCICLVKKPRTSTLLPGMETSNEQSTRVLRYTFVILAVNTFYYLTIFVLGQDSPFNLLNILLAVFSYSNTLLLLMPLMVLADATLSRQNRTLLYSQIAVFVILVLYVGSKSGLLQVLLAYALSLIAIRGVRYKAPIRQIVWGGVAVLLGFVLFVAGTAANAVQRGQLDIEDVYSAFLFALDNMSVAANGFSYRIGYLDFFLDKLLNPDYKGVFELSNYVKAVVNAITPGFNVFADMPLASRAVFNSFFGASDGPNSEAISVFAEAWHFTGYLSFLIYLPVLYIIHCLRRLFRRSSPFEQAITGLFVLYALYGYLAGFGLDYWSFVVVLYPMIFLLISIKILRRRSDLSSAKTPPTLPPTSSSAATT